MLFFSKIKNIGWKFRHITSTISYQAYLITFGHILNPLWLPRDIRRYRRSKVTSKAVMKFLELYKKDIKFLSVEEECVMEESERAFSLWLQGEDNAPSSVKACFQSMRKHLAQELVVIDENSLSDWISIPDYIIRKWKEGKIGNAHFSDICRVELLYQHGGVWFDATDYVTAEVPDFIMNSDFFVLMGGSKILSWYGFIQNCFIRAKKGNPLLKIWRDAIYKYWEKENRIITYLGHQILFQFIIQNNEQASLLFTLMPKIVQDPTHVLWYEHKDDPFDRLKYEEYTLPTFFQKTDFKDIRARNPIPNSMAAYMFSQRKVENG